MENQDVYDEIINRLKGRFINLEQYGIRVIGQPFKGVYPSGFNFTCVLVGNLVDALKKNKKFGISQKIEPKHGYDIAFREYSKPDSLHIELSLGWHQKCTIHLDKVSIVRGINDRGYVMYENLNILMQHAATDLLHKLHLDNKDFALPMDRSE
jgi:hypothetical protein